MKIRLVAVCIKISIQLVLAILMLIPNKLTAQSAIAGSKGGYWTVHFASIIDDSESKALEACRIRSRDPESCRIIAHCSTKGYGAVARGRSGDGVHAVFGASCGEETKSDAISRAINRCRYNNGKNCTIERDYNDEPKDINLDHMFSTPSNSEPQLSSLSKQQLIQFNSTIGSSNGTIITAKAIESIFADLSNTQSENPKPLSFRELASAFSNIGSELNAQMSSMDYGQRQQKMNLALSFRSIHADLGNSLDEQFWLNIARSFGYSGQ